MIVFKEYTIFFQRGSSLLRKSPRKGHVIQKAGRFSQMVPTYADTDPDLDPQQRYWQSLLVLLVAVIGR